MQSEPRGPVVGAHARAATSTALAAGQRRQRPGGARRAPGSTTPTSATACSARSLARRSGTPWRPLVSERLLEPARHAGDVVPAASRRAAGLERRPLHRCPGPRAADRHRGDGAGRAAVVAPSPTSSRGASSLGGARAPTCWRRLDCEEMQRPVTADYGLGLMLGIHPGGPAGGPQRLDARLPGRPPRGSRQRHRGGGARQRDHRHRPARPRRRRSSRATPTPRTPGRLPWRPTVAVPAEVARRAGRVVLGQHRLRRALAQRRRRAAADGARRTW